MKKALLVLSLTALGALGVAGPASAHARTEDHYGWGADGTLMVSTCEVHASYQVCGFWEPAQ